MSGSLSDCHVLLLYTLTNHPWLARYSYAVPSRGAWHLALILYTLITVMCLFWTCHRQIDVYNTRPLWLGTIQGHLLQFNQKPPLVKPTWKCEVKEPKTQEGMIAPEVRSILSEGTIEVAQGTRDSLHTPSWFPRKMGKVALPWIWSHQTDL